MSNGANTPKPVETHVETDFYWLDRLPKGVRTFLVERVYDYDSKMAYDLYQMIWENEFLPSEAVVKTNQQLMLNDINIVKQEMEIKWKSSNSSIPYNFSLPNSLMRPIRHTVSRSGIRRNHPGKTRLNGRRSPPPMEFSLYGTTPQ